MAISPEMVEVLKWPVVVFLLVGGSIGVFRRQIGGFLDRTRKIGIGKTGLIAGPAQQQAAQEVESPESGKAADELMRSFDSQLLVATEENIRADLKARSLEAKTESERVLVRYLASYQIALHFERTYAVIWDSQLDLLRTLNNYVGGVDIAIVRQTFDAWKGKFSVKDASYPFESWIGYPASQALIEVRDDKVHITETGREFLKYLVEMRRTGRGVL